jgi:hypothetical protein
MKRCVKTQSREGVDSYWLRWAGVQDLAVIAIRIPVAEKNLRRADVGSLADG